MRRRRPCCRPRAESLAGGTGAARGARAALRRDPRRQPVPVSLASVDRCGPTRCLRFCMPRRAASRPQPPLLAAARDGRARVCETAGGRTRRASCLRCGAGIDGRGDGHAGDPGRENAPPKAMKGSWRTGRLRPSGQDSVANMAEVDAHRRQHLVTRALPVPVPLRGGCATTDSGPRVTARERQDMRLGWSKSCGAACSAFGRMTSSWERRDSDAGSAASTAPRRLLRQWA